MKEDIKNTVLLIEDKLDELYDLFLNTKHSDMDVIRNACNSFKKVKEYVYG